MTTIEVNASRHYTVEIGSGLLPGLGPSPGRRPESISTV